MRRANIVAKEVVGQVSRKAFLMRIVVLSYDVFVFVRIHRMRDDFQEMIVGHHRVM